MLQGHLEKALNALLEVSKRPFPVEARLQLVKTKKDLIEKFTVFNEVKETIIREHGQSGQLNDKMPGWEEGMKQFNELCRTEVEILQVPLSIFTGDFSEDFDTLVETGVIDLGASE